MRAVSFVEGKVALEDVPSPSGEGVRVRVGSIGICGSEVHMLDKRFPIAGVPGHEFAGELEDGTPVGVEPLVPCGECELCKNGRSNVCRNQKMPGNDFNGGFASHITVPARFLCELPSDLGTFKVSHLSP